MKHGIFLKISSLALSIAMALGVGVVAANMDIEPVKAAELEAGYTTATMSAGTNGSACKVNGASGIKMGTSSKGGDMTIKVGAGATKLVFYAAAWKGVNGLKLNITPSTNISPSSVSLTADNGITGNSPFTLNGQESSFKHELVLQNITTDTIFKLTTSATKRAVVWSAQYLVGGGSTPEPEEPKTITKTLTVSEATKTLEIGDEYTPTVTDGTDTISNYKLESNDDGVASVNGTTITAVGEGTAKITVSKDDVVDDFTTTTYNDATITITVIKPIDESLLTEVTLDFTSKDQRDSLSDQSQVWSNEGVIFTNNKASSQSNVADYANPVRLYKNSQIIIEAPGNIYKITFNCISSYVLTYSGAETNGTVVTVTLTGDSTTFTIASLAAATRLSSIVVQYIGGPVEEPDFTELTYSGTYKDKYFAEEVFNRDGLTINAIFGNNEKTKDVTTSIDWPLTPLTAGTTAIAISYTDGDNTEYCNIPIEVIEKLNPIDVTTDDGDSTAELSFASTANRTSSSTSKQVWSQNGITLTNNKGSSATNVGNYSNPARFYKSSEVIISSETSFNKIDLNTTGGEYLTALEDSLSDFTIEKSGNIITVKFSEAVTEFTFTCSGGQVRLNSLTVYRSGSTTTHYANENFNAQKAVLEFVNFMNKTLDEGVCKVREYDLSSNDFAKAWASISAKYAALFSDEQTEDVVFAKNMISKATAVKDGDPLQHALYRYEKIVSEGDGIAHITAFMSQTRPLSARNNFLGITNNETSVMLIVVMSSISLLSFSCFLFLRKRKEQQ